MNPKSKDPIVRYLASLEKKDMDTLKQLGHTEKTLKEINKSLYRMNKSLEDINKM